MRCGTVEYLVGCIDYKLSTFACLLVLFTIWPWGLFFFSVSSFLPIVLLFTLRRFYFLHAPRPCHARNEPSIHIHTPCSLKKQPDPLFINRIFLFLPPFNWQDRYPFLLDAWFQFPRLFDVIIMGQCDFFQLTPFRKCVYLSLHRW